MSSNPTSPAATAAFFGPVHVGQAARASDGADTAAGFNLVHRFDGDCWLHHAQPVWIVHYPATPDRAGFFQAYRAVARVPAGRRPWTVDNRRVGTDRGFATFEAVVRAAEHAIGVEDLV